MTYRTSPPHWPSRERFQRSGSRTSAPALMGPVDADLSDSVEVAGRAVVDGGGVDGGVDGRPLVVSFCAWSWVSPWTC